MDSVSNTIDEWVRRSSGAFSLYWRGSLAKHLKISCPLCGKPLKRVRGSGGKRGKWVCNNLGCKLIEVRLYKGFVEVRIEPLQTITYRLYKVWCEAEKDIIPVKWGR